MKINFVLAKIYWLASAVASASILVICLLFKWNTSMMLVSMIACLVISAPSVIAVNAMCWLLKRFQLAVSFLWVIILSSIPVLAMIPAFIFCDELPGDVIFLLGLGMISCYAGILRHGQHLTQLFKTIGGE
jgi:hypothetical protein